MANTKRYAVEGTYSVDKTITVENYDSGKTTDIIIESADLRDKQNGDVFREGAFRVRVIGSDANLKECRTKQFFGETAWSDAERYANDALFAIRRAEHAY